MTSSFNIARRNIDKRPINWNAYFRNGGVCPTGFLTVPLNNNTDWKFCVPLDEQTNTPELTWQTPSINNYIKNSEQDSNQPIRRFTDKLYNDNTPDQTQFNLYPPESRRKDRRFLDLYDYFRLPMNFDGTGYNPTRGYRDIEYAEDNIAVLPYDDPFRLIQPHQVQQDTNKVFAKRKQHNIPPYYHPYQSHFYKNLDDVYY